VNLTDIHTASYLEDFKEKYFSKIEKVHQKYEAFKSLPDIEQAKADKAKSDYQFFYSLIACVEATLEQNMALKVRLKELENSSK
jgi:hypothetical protein